VRTSSRNWKIESTLYRGLQNFDFLESCLDKTKKKEETKKDEFAMKLICLCRRGKTRHKQFRSSWTQWTSLEFDSYFNLEKLWAEELIRNCKTFLIIVIFKSLQRKWKKVQVIKTSNLTFWGGNKTLLKCVRLGVSLRHVDSLAAHFCCPTLYDTFCPPPLPR